MRWRSRKRIDWIKRGGRGERSEEKEEEVEKE